MRRPRGYTSSARTFPTRRRRRLSANSCGHAFKAPASMGSGILQTTGSFVWISRVVTGRSLWSRNCSAEMPTCCFLIRNNACSAHSDTTKSGAVRFTVPLSRLRRDHFLRASTKLRPRRRPMPSPSHFQPHWTGSTVSVRRNCPIRGSSDHGNLFCEKTSRNTFAAWRPSAAISNRPRNTNPIRGMANC